MSNKKRKYISAIILIPLAYFIHHWYEVSYMENYYKTFYSNLEKGDVTSNECLKAWEKVTASTAPYNYQEETSSDYLYDYKKRRCLLYTIYYRTMTDYYATDYHEEKIVDLITGKILFWYKNDGSKNINVYDYESGKEWHADNLDSGNFPFAQFKELKELVK